MKANRHLHYRIMKKSCRYLAGLLLLPLLVLSLHAESGGTSSGKRPDIVFILLDDLRFDGLSYKDHPYVETPHVDELRSMGADMANAFVTTSMCCPSRATFLTGTYASQHGVIDNETSEYDPELTPPLTKELQAAGYKTAMVGKWHMGHSDHPRPYFDYWLSFESQGRYFDPELNINGERVTIPGYTTDILTDKAIEFIKDQPLDQPYFCMLSHKAVHQPFKPAPRHETAFGADTVDIKPESWKADFATKPVWQRREQLRPWRWEWRTRDIAAEEVPDRIPAPHFGTPRYYVKQYRCLAAVDDGVGRILKTLRERGTLDNTLIIFTSDNGYFHGEHRRWDKRLAYEESIRIPMVVVHPGKIEPGSTVEEVISNLDFAPTVLAAAGIEKPEVMQGRDFGPLLRGEEVPWNSDFFYEYWVDLVHSIPTMVALRTDRYKLVRYPEINDLDELYDLEQDPYELTNLAGDPEAKAIHEKMEAQLVAKADKVGWQPRIFPKNLPLVKGEEGTLIDLTVKDDSLVEHSESSLSVNERGVELADGMMHFDGEGSGLRVAANPELEPNKWPYVVTVEFNAEGDGTLVSQSGTYYGFEIFIQDGQVGVSTRCQTWKPSLTTIDAPGSVLDRWVEVKAVVHYNRLALFIDGEFVDSRPLPQPFKGNTRAPLFVGLGSERAVVPGTPNTPFKGKMRRFTVERTLIPGLAKATVNR
jgi:N-acetylglucosamine-6-sulfatase